MIMLYIQNKVSPPKPPTVSQVPHRQPNYTARSFTSNHRSITYKSSRVRTIQTNNTNHSPQKKVKKGTDAYALRRCNNR